MSVLSPFCPYASTDTVKNVKEKKIVTECFEVTKVLGKWNLKGGPQHRALLTCFCSIELERLNRNQRQCGSLLEVENKRIF